MAAAAATMSALKLSPAHLKSQFTGEPLANTPSTVAPARSSSLVLARASSSSSSHHELQQSSRRSAIFTLTSAAATLVAANESRAVTGIKVNGPPPLSGGLPGTENADQPRDLDLPLKERFFIQPLSPAEAVNRIKDASKDIVGVKDLIAKKSWPYVRNDLRNKATYLRYDLNTVISSKSKEERKAIKKLTSKLFETLIDPLSFSWTSQLGPRIRRRQRRAMLKRLRLSTQCLPSFLRKINQKTSF